jgi:surface protein
MFSARQGFGGAQRPFMMTIKTDQTTSGNKTFILPVIGNYIVDWGDGSKQIFNTSFPQPNFNASSHTYATAGSYQIKLYGNVRWIQFYDIFFGRAYNPDQLISIDQWGDIYWQNLSFSFYNCVNMTGNFSDSPNLINFQDMPVTGGGGSVYPPSLGGTFARCTLFNSNINDWNVSRVTAMGSMFEFASSFNQPLNNWNVSLCSSFASMFTSSAFNQNISNWNLSGLNGRSQGCENMFRSSAFNQNLSTWNITGIASGTNPGNRSLMFLDIFLSSGMNTENYSKTLIGWANQISNNGGSPIYVRIGNASGLTYNSTNYGGSPFSDAYAARSYLTTSIAGGGVSWQITGDTGV